MVPTLEAVPNFSEGRDLDRVQELVATIESRGADVLDWSADPDHHRSVITFVGAPEVVEEAAVAVAERAVELIDLRTHRGVHPRVGALDVLPFVPLTGLRMEDAVASARGVAERLAGLGVPAYLYGRASEPPGRRLAELRKGGFERLVEGFPPGREPDKLPSGWRHPGAHPTAGAVCVGAREVLLAWNVDVEGVPEGRLRELTDTLRETGGGFPGLRALALALAEQRRVQVSMNLEDLERVSPMEVFAAIEAGVQAEGGRVAGTEVIGLVPDQLVLPAARDRLRLRDVDRRRLLSARLATHLSERAHRAALDLLEALREAGDAVPSGVRRAARGLESSLVSSATRSDAG